VKSGLAYPGRLGQFPRELLLVQISSWSSDDCVLVRLLLLLVFVLVRRQTLQLGVDGIIDVIIGVACGDIERRQCYDRTRHRHQIQLTARSPFLSIENTHSSRSLTLTSVRYSFDEQRQHFSQYFT